MQGYHGVRPGWTRVSLAYYTSTQEAEFVLDAVDFVASFGHRFLPLYTFDWKTGDWHYDHARARGLLPNNVRNSCASAGASGSSGRVKTECDYQDYMAFARELADFLDTACRFLDGARARRIPKGVDPQLVYFVV